MTQTKSPADMLKEARERITASGLEGPRMIVVSTSGLGRMAAAWGQAAAEARRLEEALRAVGVNPQTVAPWNRANVAALFRDVEASFRQVEPPATPKSRGNGPASKREPWRRQGKRKGHRV